MTDIELLKLAAKAVGAEYEIDKSSGYMSILSEIGGVSGHWDPLENDEDAFRLAIKLGFLFSRELEYQLTLVRLLGDDSDEFSILRRAIVRVAAEIGKGMK